MKVLVIGAGFVGIRGRRPAQGAAATRSRVTTTTPAKVDDLAARFGNVVVLRGSDREAVAAAVAGQDAVVVTAGPNAAAGDDAGGPRRRRTRRSWSTPPRVSWPPAATRTSWRCRRCRSTAARPNHLDEVTEDSPVTDSPGREPALLPRDGAHLPRRRRPGLRLPLRRRVRRGRPADRGQGRDGAPVPRRLGAVLRRRALLPARRRGRRRRGRARPRPPAHRPVQPDPPRGPADEPRRSSTRSAPPRTCRPWSTATRSPLPTRPISVAKLAAAGFTAGHSFDRSYAALV